MKGPKKNPELDAAREQRGIYFIPDDDPDYEEVVKQRQKKIGNKEGVSDALQSLHTTPPEQFTVQANGLRMKRITKTES